MSGKAYRIDIPVLLIFFNRPKLFAQTFAAVKEARPSKLFLYQDGPRAGRDDDVRAVAECRKIAEDIDWDCEVHKFYQEKNLGCDPSGYTAQTWAFSRVDRCIVIEDDLVADQSFFSYCAELLERYKDDERVAMICGMNHMGDWSPEGNSYYFSNTGPISGWASWRRVVSTWDPAYCALDNEYVRGLLADNYRDIGLDRHLFDMLRHKQDGRAFFETILGLSRFTQHRLCILPEHNLIRNIGYGVDAAHTIRESWINRIPVRALDFPLRHPRYMMNDTNYSRAVLEKSRGPRRWTPAWFKHVLVHRILKG